MNDFILEVVATVVGVGAASGLFYRDDSVYLISDNSNYLYHYSLSANMLSKTLLVDSDTTREQLPKKQKRDFEAISTAGNCFYIYGSGSGNIRKRNMQVAINVADSGWRVQKDLTTLYTRLRSLFNIADDDFNIEGAVHHDGQTYLFNRGNGPGHVNGIFRLGAAAQDTAFIPVDLPKLEGIQAAFTDAVVLDDKLYFLAAAEDAESTYYDGSIYGTLLGTLSLPDLSLQRCVVISPSHKFEGLTFVKRDAKRLTFFLCEDADTGDLETNIYQLSLSE